MSDPTNPGDPNQPGAGYPPPGGYSGQAAPPSHGGFPPPPGGYAPPGNYPQPGGYAPPGGHAQAGGYAPPGYGQPMPAFEGERGQLLHAFIGNNADRYLRVFHKLEASGSSMSWNWAAFFANIFWLAHRKLFVAAGSVAAGIAVAILLAGTLAPNQLMLIAILAVLIPVLIAGAIGMFGDAMLKKRADMAVQEAMHRYPDSQSRLAAAAATGGSSGVGLAVSIVGWLAFQLGIQTTGISPYKQFQDARARAVYSSASSSASSSRSSSSQQGTAGPAGATPAFSQQFLIGRWGSGSCGPNYVEYRADGTAYSPNGGTQNYSVSGDMVSMNRGTTTVESQWTPTGPDSARVQERGRFFNAIRC